MAGLSSTLEIARTTLLNQQILIQTASHNIANAENQAYARQKVNQITNPAYRMQGGWVGTGARIDTITQVRDQYIDQRLLASTSQASDYRTRAGFLETIGSYLNDTGEVGLSQDLGRFWDAWDGLSQNPTGLSERQGVISAAESLASSFRSTQTNLTSLKEKIQSQTTDTVTRINTLLNEIADYNYTIIGLESGGDSANDLRDSRFQALTELSQLAGISYVEEANGSLTVSLKDGGTTVTLVSNHEAGSLAFDQPSGLVSYTDASGSTYGPDPNALVGGTLAGLLASAQKTTEFNDRLVTMADELINQVNNLYGDTVFYSDATAILAVSDSFKDPATLNADPATAIAELQNTRLAALDDSRLIDYLGAIQQQIGLDQQDASSRADFQETLAEYLGAQQQSVSGVSIDEEMIDLLQYQQIYQAAAKIVETTRTLLNTVIEMAG